MLSFSTGLSRSMKAQITAQMAQASTNSAKNAPAKISGHSQTGCPKPLSTVMIREIRVTLLKSIFFAPLYHIFVLLYGIFPPLTRLNK